MTALLMASLMLVPVLLWRSSSSESHRSPPLEDDDDREGSPPKRRRRRHDIVADTALPIVFSSTSSDDADDAVHYFSHPDPLDYEARRESRVPDWGPLDINFFLYDDDGSIRRSIYYDHRDDWTYEMLQHWDPVTREELEDGVKIDDVDYYYAFDDDIKRNPLIAYDDDTIQDEQHCRRTSWHRDLHLNCNALHEFDVEFRFRADEASFLGHGAYRYAYLAELREHVEETVIFKSFRYDADYASADFEYMRIDAMVAEMFTSSPRLVGIYGSCGLAMINQAVMGGRMEPIALPYDDDSDEEYEHLIHLIDELEEKNELVAMNNLTGTEKLVYALEMAEPVLLLHANPGGVIVHDDISLEQYLVADDGSLMLNDFNRAEPMFWNEEAGEYCRYRNNPGNGAWRAPEEYKDDPLDEKIDIFSLGNNFYALLTGLPPFIKLIHEDTFELKKAVMDGEIEFIDPRWRERSFGERVLADLIPICWKREPDERIDIFELVRQLREAVEEDQQRMETEQQNHNLRRS